MLKYIFQLYLKESQLALLRNNKLNIFKFFNITCYYFFISLTFIIKRFPLFIKPPLATARAAQCVGALHLFVSFFVSLSAAKMQKTHFSQKLSSLELWCLLTIYRKSYMGISRTHYWTHKIQDG